MMRSLILVLMIALQIFAQPKISLVTGNGFTNGSILVIKGDNFGKKIKPGPLIWDDLEDGKCDKNASIGAWETVNDLEIGTMKNRSSLSKYNATFNFDREAEAAFSGGPNSSKWFIQYWFLLDEDWNFSSNGSDNLGNIKYLRLWNTGKAEDNFRISSNGTYDIQAVIEHVNQSQDWSPVVEGYNWIDEVLSHKDPGYVDPSNLGWKNFEIDLSLGIWHCFQFEYKDSDINEKNGHLKWWFDGKLILDKNNFITQTDTYHSLKRIKYAGFYNSFGANADGNDHLYIDDVYGDTVFSRVEIGDNGVFDDCHHREIQIPTKWENTQIELNINCGSFKDLNSKYIFVVDAEGKVSDGYEIGVKKVTAPSKVMLKR